MAQVINQVCAAIVPALKSPHPQYELIRGLLFTLTQLETRPLELAEVAYDWCAMIWKNRQSYEDWTTPILLSLEVGFRHIRPSGANMVPPFSRTEYHQGVHDLVLDSKNIEAITDLAWASFAFEGSGQLGLKIVDRVVNRPGGVTEPFPRDLGRIFARCMEFLGLEALEYVEKQRFVELLNCLDIDFKDQGRMGRRDAWAAILLEIIQSPDGAQHLAIQFWEFLVEIIVAGHGSRAAYNPGVALTYLVDGNEWDKLECWLGIVWMLWPPESGNVPKVLEDTMKSLFQQQPDAVQRLTQRMEQWEEKAWGRMPETFQQTCDKLVQ